MQKLINLTKILLAVCLLTVSPSLLAQQIRVSGSVTDKDGAPVVGAGIVQKGVPSNGTVTNLDGKFTISVPQGAVLTVSSIGYKEVELPAQPQMDIVLQDDNELLEEAVVVAKAPIVTVSADTLGNFTVDGSDDSAYLAENEKRFAAFASGMKALDEQGGMNSEMARLFIAHYRECVNFVLAHPGSLACVPVLYESLNEYSPVFNQLTDAIIFRKVCDSLTAVYPDSRYVKALQKETERRENLLSVQNRVNNAEEMDYPELSLPGIDGKEVSLSGLAAKAVIVHFWDPSDAEQKMFNLDVLMPLYERWHSRGLEIYSVGVSASKPAWALVVNSQKLPWVNVCDGLGAASPAILRYNVGQLPTSVLIVDKEGIVEVNGGLPGLEKTLAKVLK